MAVPLRLKDSVLAFQAGDAQIPIEYYKDTYASFRKSVVLPGMRLPIKLKIPKIKTQNAKIILGLYDIIVAVDSKSSPIKKAQFVYAFNYSLTKETREEAQEIIPMIIKR